MFKNHAINKSNKIQSKFSAHQEKHTYDQDKLSFDHIIPVVTPSGMEIPFKVFYQADRDLVHDGDMNVLVAIREAKNPEFQKAYGDIYMIAGRDYRKLSNAERMVALSYAVITYELFRDGANHPHSDALFGIKAVEMSQIFSDEVVSPMAIDAEIRALLTAVYGKAAVKEFYSKSQKLMKSGIKIITKAMTDTCKEATYKAAVKADKKAGIKVNKTVKMADKAFNHEIKIVEKSQKMAAKAEKQAQKEAKKAEKKAAAEPVVNIAEAAASLA